jgi:hypothetical protein
MPSNFSESTQVQKFAVSFPDELSYFQSLPPFARPHTKNGLGLRDQVQMLPISLWNFTLRTFLHPSFHVFGKCLTIRIPFLQIEESGEARDNEKISGEAVQANCTAPIREANF